MPWNARTVKNAHAQPEKLLCAEIGLVKVYCPFTTTDDGYRSSRPVARDEPVIG